MKKRPLKFHVDDMFYYFFEEDGLTVIRKSDGFVVCRNSYGFGWKEALGIRKINCRYEDKINNDANKVKLIGK